MCFSLELFSSALHEAALRVRFRCSAAVPGVAGAARAEAAWREEAELWERNGDSWRKDPTMEAAAVTLCYATSRSRPAAARDSNQVLASAAQWVFPPSLEMLIQDHYF